VDPGFQAFARGDSRGQYFRDLHRDPVSLERLRRGLDRIAAATRARSVPVLLVLFPLLLDPADGAYPLGDVHDVVASEARARALRVLDLEPAYARAASRGEPLARDFLHPNQRGSRVAATAILEHLEAGGLLPAGR
jgi:hypothetical protein